ncbi:alpha/beta hydrolase [Desulfoluna spongiiphila]|uniref:Acetyl esterase/lipase n=1 Tax=Desulfoluna spongiiphila TaxID=419481 RepID=A0A1G5DIK2_9BACT|nr:alpha/beta hydrolase [Desulfoluna spongiiphila]SCY14407.1 Acetyl esterase/lipase [Desulfoluna spongiiphila]VVS95117.1 alpha/beta hydrolase fold [Desulfoluna spongiiphila]
MRRVSPKLEAWLKTFNALLAHLQATGFKATPTNAREGLANLTRGLVTTSPEVAWIQDDFIHSPAFKIPVRIYHPDPSRPLPVLVFFHGGGHMAGSVTVYDPIFRKTALATNHVVVAPDYRLAPECPYPAAVNDAYYTVKGVWGVLESRGLPYEPRLSIAGDSGGGALCATVAHLAQHDAGITISRQAMIYPSLDYTMEGASMDENAVGYLLETKKVLWYFDNYFQHSENRNAASPLHMEVTDKLPETLVITAEFCPLRDEGAAYVRKVEEAGVAAEQLHFHDMIHTFMNMEDLVREECEAVYTKIANFLNRT